MSSVDIVIVNWNAGDLIRSCVESIALVADEVDLQRIVVVDNASTDHSIDFLRRQKNANPEPGTRNLPLVLIENATNIGFAAGCNAGARNSRADYLLFLNPDTRLKPGALRIPAEFLDDTKNADVGIVGIQLVDEEDRVLRTCARMPTPWRAVAQMAALEKVLPRLDHFESDWDHMDTREVDQVMGAFFFTRRRLFEELGGFDERFFVYLEEVDYTQRARVRGYSTWHLSEARAFHYGAGTTEQVKDRRLFYVLRSRTLYFFKHFGRLHAFAYLTSVLTLELLSRLAQATLHRSATALKEVLSGYRLLISDLPAIIGRALDDAPAENQLQHPMETPGYADSRSRSSSGSSSSSVN